jgi:FkbM family methyltransferase
MEIRNSEKASLRHDLLGDGLIIYGAGGAGRSVAHHLRSRGRDVEAFLDAAATEGAVCDGVRVFAPERWLASHDAGTYEVLICVHNPLTRVPPIIDRLRAAGFGRVATMVDYIDDWPDDPELRYWLAPKDFYSDKEQSIAAASALLQDQASLRWMEATLRLRRRGDYHSMPEPGLSDQYFPEDLLRWPEPIRLLDCGAYDGDSIAAIIAAGYRLEDFIACEPDPANYAKLRARFPGIGGSFLPVAVSDRTGVVSFSVGRGPASHMAEGGAPIKCVSIDQAFFGFAPNLIKMDIEGSELAALRGAVKTIRHFRPSLAISIYHNPADLWEIPLFIERLGANYNMFIRGHGQNGFDLVLYCLPL